jgi:hypothetical protein
MAVVHDRDKLCSSCSLVPPVKDFIFGYDEMWGSFQQFKSSALNGCPLCSYLYNAGRVGWDSCEKSADLNPGPPFSLKWNGQLPLRPPLVNEDHNMIMEHAYEFLHGVQYSIFVDPGKNHCETRTSLLPGVDD